MINLKLTVGTYCIYVFYKLHFDYLPSWIHDADIRFIVSVPLFWFLTLWVLLGGVYLIYDGVTLLYKKETGNHD